MYKIQFTCKDGRKFWLASATAREINLTSAVSDAYVANRENVDSMLNFINRNHDCSRYTSIKAVKVKGK